ncbi:DUF3800 domain-containing protein [Desulfoluna spongiiphila]|uniref:DUF3800 domain-containing protein n=1 Tax=Desulfoluna spongiiphila TaxID=419481 RepID=UPI00125428D7|nr:DUF3800 domain-containing protein [Desulfoluna spongiiphila]VVS91428.1 hypothetical protein DBB_9960 [Desulfoluna spongiiphila]
MKDIRKQPYRPNPGLVPQDLYEKRVVCPKCKREFQIPWTEKLEFPLQPIEPNQGGGYWVAAGIELCCPYDECNHKFEISVPNIPNESRWVIYGDEAGRYIDKPNPKYSTDPLNFFCITLVGLHNSKQEKLQRQLNKLKSQIRPSEPPETWQHHFTDIWNENGSSGKYNLQTKKSKISYVNKFAKLIRESRPELVSFNISGCIIVPKDKKERKKQIRFQKENIFSQTILTTLNELRKQKKTVKWVFDNVKDTTGGPRTEGWASECFLGLQYTRLFTWLSYCAPVLEPEFVAPGSHCLLEVADFMSFWYAREFQQSVNLAKPEIPSSYMGTGFFHGTIGDGTVRTRWNRGLPLKEFYGIGRTKI